MVSTYLAGLRIDTQMHVRMFQPHTIRQCLTLAKLYETTHPKMSGGNLGVGKNGGGNQFKPPLLPFKKESSMMQKPVFGSKVQEKSGEGNSLGRKFLTHEEMSDKRAKGLCYFCDEPYSPGHYLKQK